MNASEFNTRLLELQDQLTYFAKSLTHNEDDAYDLVQDTFLKAITYRDKFTPDTNLKAWTYTIMKNTFINNYRKNQKANTIIDTTEDLYYLNNNKVSEFEAPDSTYHHQEIRNGIEELSDEQRIPFEMHFDGYKYKEIADHLDLSIGTVKSRIFFTRQKLMRRLKDFREGVAVS